MSNDYESAVIDAIAGNASVYEQVEIEGEILGRVDNAIAVAEHSALLAKHQKRIAAIDTRLSVIGKISNKFTSCSKKQEIELVQLRSEKDCLEKLIQSTTAATNSQHSGGAVTNKTTTSANILSVVGEQSSSIRFGHLTPFEQKALHVQDRPSTSAQALTDFDKFLLQSSSFKDSRVRLQKKVNFSKRKVAEKSSCSVENDNLLSSPRKGISVNSSLDYDDDKSAVVVKRKRPLQSASGTTVGSVAAVGNESEYDPDSDFEDDFVWKTKKTRKSKKKNNFTKKQMEHSKLVDDGSDKAFDKRLKVYKREKIESKLIQIEQTGVCDESDDENEIEIDGSFRMPALLWDKLYKFQRTGVRWLWELHEQSVGGILGDEMGLGKTIQIIAFLMGLRYSKLDNKFGFDRGLNAVLIICPTSIMHQWVREFHTWCPEMRVAVLHDSGSFSGSKPNLLRKIFAARGVVIASYSCLTFDGELLRKYNWHYVILDEGHKIRNPDAKVTLAAKQFNTPHRLILSGSPLQNALRELWSLFDFIYPGRLGTLPVFVQEFSVPITQGGYANASKIQVETAYKCAVVLREAISPYLLRRMKGDVQMIIQLPTKKEQVLFCRLSQSQRLLYKEYLKSRECDSILSGKMQAFVGLITLRKLCNHPDLINGGPLEGTGDKDSNYGYFERSGKMIVVNSLLKLWKEQSHRVLIFSQSRQMLNILENHIKQKNWTYSRLDGLTAISKRQPIVEKFNTDDSIFVFLLTTRVGGLGLNLVGADRVIIFDPDWNPSTDVQARERAWRIGQTRPVTIYRLLCAGTIEEKIYHRQIFKQFLANRILSDPKQRRFFKMNDLHDLFTLTDDITNDDDNNKNNDCMTETSSLFAGMGSEVEIDKNNYFDGRKLNAVVDVESKFETDEEHVDYVPMQQDITLSDIKMNEMKQRAKELSAKFAESGPRSSVKKHSSTKVDGVKIENVTSKEIYQSSNLAESVVEEKELLSSIPNASKIAPSKLLKKVKKLKRLSQSQDDYVLSKLFKKANVHSALAHDKIVESSHSDITLIESEADKIASSAVRHLTESRRNCQRGGKMFRQPTWTGKFGTCGAPQRLPAATAVQRASFKKKSGSSKPSGSDLLAKIRGRVVSSTNDRNDDGSIPDVASTSSGINLEVNSIENDYNELIQDIQNYLSFQSSSASHEATTNELIDKFKNKIKSKDTTVFISMLKKIATFHRNSNGKGVWRLKSEFH